MKLTVLGCWAPYPKAGGACSGYLLQSGGNNILIDCGNGVVSNLQKYIDFRQLNAVVISHFHPDHYMDLYCLRHAVGGARRLRPGLVPLDLYVPSQPAEVFQQMGRFTEAFNVKPIEILPQTQEKAGIEQPPVFEAFIGEGNGSDGVKVLFQKTDHPMPAYAMLFETRAGKVFYSADTKWTSYLTGFAQGADLAICEASVIEEDSEYTSVGHLTARQAGMMAREGRAVRLIITHFWPEYSPATIRSEAETGFGKPVTVAVEGLQVEIK